MRTSLGRAVNELETPLCVKVNGSRVIGEEAKWGVEGCLHTAIECKMRGDVRDVVGSYDFGEIRDVRVREV